jgi:hypothetical protein
MDLYNDYVDVIQQTLPLRPDEWTFKSVPNYYAVLEHVCHGQGTAYFSCIINEFNDIYTSNKDALIQLCHQNDMYGKPRQYEFQDFTVCSPTDLRYIYHSLLNLKHMQTLGLNDINIVEIGGGYGGLCFFMKNLAKYFDITISSYHIFDLKLPTELQAKYLNALNITDTTFSVPYDTTQLKQNSYLIANYSLSEFTREIQADYNNALGPYITNGLIVSNDGEPDIMYDIIKDILKNNKLTVEEERPKTSPQNLFVYF